MAGTCQARKALNTPDKDDDCLPLLPHNIVVDILSRMPVKSLLRMRSVCKQWNDLIRDRYFIKKHLSHSNVFYEWKDESSDEDDDDKPKKKKFRVLYVCHGMLLKSSKGASKKYLIENPAIREILYLPDSVHEYKHDILFCFVPSTDEYKLVCIYGDTTTGYLGCEVFTAGVDDSWRPLELPNLHGVLPNGSHLSVAHVGAVVHCFKAKKLGQILVELISLDLESECFASTALEPGLFSDWMDVWVVNWDGRPALAQRGKEELKVLVIEDYKEKHKLAEKMLTVPFEAAEQDLRGDDDHYTDSGGQGFLWICLGDDTMSPLTAYDIKHRRLRREMSWSDNRYPLSCRESLVTLKGMVKQPSA